MSVVADSVSDLPDDWEWKKLVDVVDILDSRRRPINAKERATRQGDVPYYGATGQVGYIDDYLFDEELVLLGEDGAPFLDPSKHKAYVIRGKTWVNNHAHVLRGKDGIQNAYIKHYLDHFDYHGYVTGTTRLKLNQGRMQEIPIPIAPKEQRERIVAEIEKQFSRLDEAVASLKRVKANLKRYKASVLKAAVEGKLTEEWRKQNPDVEPASKLLERILAERRAKWEEAELAKMNAQGKEPKNDKWKEKYDEPMSLFVDDLPPLPRGWSWVRLEQLLENLRNGISNKPDQADGLAILRISAVRPLAVDMQDVRYLSQNLIEEFSDYVLQNGDLLFTRYNGNPEFVGACGVVRDALAPTVHPDKIIRAQVINKIASQPSYLELVLNVGESRAHIASKVRTTAGQSGVSGGDIKNVPVPLPPVDEQQVLVALAAEKLSIVESLVKQINVYLLRGERLRSSILGQAFGARIN